jgi:hypothetical protein
VPTSDALCGCVGMSDDDKNGDALERPKRASTGLYVRAQAGLRLRDKNKRRELVETEHLFLRAPEQGQIDPGGLRRSNLGAGVCPTCSEFRLYASRAPRGITKVQGGE